MFFSPVLFLSGRKTRGTEHAVAKIFFAIANLKNAEAFGVKRFGVLIETSKHF
jgi:hypothetical protein